MDRDQATPIPTSTHLFSYTGARADTNRRCVRRLLVSSHVVHAYLSTQASTLESMLYRENGGIRPMRSPVPILAKDLPSVPRNMCMPSRVAFQMKHRLQCLTTFWLTVCGYPAIECLQARLSLRSFLRGWKIDLPLHASVSP